MNLYKRKIPLDDDFVRKKRSEYSEKQFKSSEAIRPALNNENENLFNINDFNVTLFSAEIEYDYPKMLLKIKENVMSNDSDNFNNLKSLKIKMFNGNFATFNLPSNLNLASILSSSSFNLNFKNAFGVELNTVKFYNIKFPSVQVIVTNTSTADSRSLQKSDLNYFRQLICLLFSHLFNLKFTQCSCYPQKINELILIQAGFNMNCINALECNSFMNANPNFYDPFVLGPCKDTDMNVSTVILNSINAFSLDGNIEISQDIKVIFGEILKTLNKKIIQT